MANRNLMKGNSVANKFMLDRTNGKFLGVCAGLANNFGIDALFIRIAFVASVLLGFGLPLIIYFAIALLAD
jgi:phage shock protein C